MDAILKSQLTAVGWEGLFVLLKVVELKMGFYN